MDAEQLYLIKEIKSHVRAHGKVHVRAHLRRGRSYVKAHWRRRPRKWSNPDTELDTIAEQLVLFETHDPSGAEQLVLFETNGPSG